MMEYVFYAEQIYRLEEGIAQVRMLPVQEAEALGYKGGCTAQKPEGRLYVDGFDSEIIARYHLKGLTDCRTTNREELRRWQQM